MKAKPENCSGSRDQSGGLRPIVTTRHGMHVSRTERRSLVSATGIFEGFIRNRITMPTGLSGSSRLATNLPRLTTSTATLPTIGGKICAQQIAQLTIVIHHVAAITRRELRASARAVIDGLRRSWRVGKSDISEFMTRRRKPWPRVKQPRRSLNITPITEEPKPNPAA